MSSQALFFRDADRTASYFLPRTGATSVANAGEGGGSGVPRAARADPGTIAEDGNQGF